MNQFTARAISVLYNRIIFIGVVTAVVAVLAVAMELLNPPAYRAEAVLVVTAISEDESAPKLMPEPLSPKVYQSMLTSTAVVGTVLDRLKAEGVFAEGEAPALETFQGMLLARVDVVDETTRPVNYSPLITLLATAPDNDTAVRIVNAWAEAGMAMAERAITLRSASAQGALAGREQQYRDALYEVMARQQEESARFNTTVMLQELNDYQALLKTLREESATTARDLAAAKLRLTEISSILETDEPLIELRRAPSEDVYWLREGDDAAEGIASKQMITEQTNPAYWALRQEANELRGEVSALQAKMEEQNRQLSETEQTRDELEALLAEHEAIQEKLLIESELSQKIYRSVAEMQDRVDTAAALAEASSADMPNPSGLNRLSREVYAKEDKGALGRKGRVALAALIALCFAVGWTLFHDIGLPAVKRLMLEAS